jgi:hypothetical protein
MEKGKQPVPVHKKARRTAHLPAPQLAQVPLHRHPSSSGQIRPNPAGSNLKKYIFICSPCRAKASRRRIRSLRLLPFNFPVPSSALKKSYHPSCHSRVRSELFGPFRAKHNMGGPVVPIRTTVCRAQARVSLGAPASRQLRYRSSPSPPTVFRPPASTSAHLTPLTHITLSHTPVDFRSTLPRGIPTLTPDFEP